MDNKKINSKLTTESVLTIGKKKLKGKELESLLLYESLKEDFRHFTSISAGTMHATARRLSFCIFTRLKAHKIISAWSIVEIKTDL